ncbi:transcription antitermination factor NusB [Candidatus Finniella inopinata]|uniref:Transcription antitermination protein NusB n=1 Tax=Candidatus Finniella inopinata TaxID=1696036 RepID=A0A4Q7DKR2_9PROT|nr:transcription antitermination factor NusB [Candidatus Finniella inopinata]RZI46919.1 transcription antitermination factor NusB [Candidatus Finniella inopinata]
MLKDSKPRISARHSSRLKGVQALYQHELTSDDMNSIVEQVVSAIQEKAAIENFKGLVPDLEFFKEIVLGTHKNREAVDEEITANLSQGWRLERLPLVVLCILRQAVYELRYQPLVPGPVIINEYIEITKDFFDEAETSFVNGILDAISKKSR